MANSIEPLFEMQKWESMLLNYKAIISGCPYLKNDPTLGFLVCSFPVLGESYGAWGLRNISATLKCIACLKSLQAMRKSKNKNGYWRHHGLIATKKEHKRTRIYYSITTIYYEILQYYYNILPKKQREIHSQFYC